MKGFWSQLEAELERNEPVWLVLVVAHGRGSPGTAGARMFVCADGRQVGTIGGSVMEYGLLRRARELLAAKPSVADLPELQRFVHRRSDPAAIAPGESGLICSGWQQQVSVTLRPERDQDTIRSIAKCDRQGGHGSIRFTRSGMQFGDVQPDLMAPAIDLQTEGGWRVEVQLLNRQRLVIFGGGHCGLALSRVMAELGWYVTVVDRRADVATLRANHCADQQLVVEDFTRGAELLDWTPLTDAVVMTTDYHSDVRALLGCLRQPLRSIGVMGSAAKLRAIRGALTEAGVSAAEQARIRGPVGLPMKSDTPAEIAVSIAAELLQFAER